ncbi:RNA-binding protein Nova-2 isoform X2 [Daphnia magna]|uniref:RNA-binding protein Nova-2 isoform X2 n=1 Tax=Daphnia magna TaxID=35525 RepID=UPI0006E0D42E|nr:RNA-binding protein Nova-2 isoform X2 [Daphnia magna]
MASTESDTRTSREDSIRSPKFDDDDSPEHSERKRPLDGDSDLSDRKKSHFTGDGSIYLKVLVPSVAAGAIIGKGGETIAQVQKEVNARIKMSKANDFYPGTTERVCLIKGTTESVMSMLTFICEKIRDKPDPNAKPAMDFDSKTPAERDKQVKILVPNSTAGMIIGKGGSFIKQIKEESGAYIQISQKAKDQALQERCITVIGDSDCNRKACCMILSKIAEDPQSGSCLNVSYAEVTGPVANFNPTGSPYAHNGGVGGSGGVGGNGNSGGYSPVHNGNNGASPYLNNMSVNLNIGVGLSQPNPAMLSQLMDHLRSSLRSAGYPEQSLSEVGQAINTLASYGMIGMNFSTHGNSAVDSVANVAGSWINHNVSASDGGHGVPSSSPGPFGPIGSSPHRYNESSFDPFRGRGSYQTPLPLNNNSFGLGSPHSPVAQDRTSDSINTSPRGSENSRRCFLNLKGRSCKWVST